MSLPSGLTFFFPSLLLQVEVPPLVVDSVLQEEVVAFQPPTTFDIEKEIPSREEVEETRKAPNVVKDTESMQASIPPVAHDPGVTQTPILKDPTFG